MVTENGQGKQVTFDSFTVHGRATQGQRIYKLGGKADFIVGALAVNDENDVVCVTLMGQTLRVHVKNISIQGRNATGVRVVTMKSAKDSIVAIASTGDEGEEELEEDELLEGVLPIMVESTESVEVEEESTPTETE
jgi:DNA gyrase subunit A